MKEYNEEILEWEETAWTCDTCRAANHVMDAECQFCDRGLRDLLPQ